MLQTVAQRLQDSLRSSDVVARLGGDEFAVFVKDIMSVDVLSRICEKIIHQVSQPFLTQDGIEIYTSPSIGIALFPRDGEDFDTLGKNADVAMYESKRKGRGTYTYYKEALSPACELRFKLEQRLPMAIEKGELVLHYQLKVRLSDFKIVGFEALARWQHPELGLMSPADFIPLAEELGLIADLGEWGLRSCCALLAQWQTEGVLNKSIDLAELGPGSYARAKARGAEISAFATLYQSNEQLPIYHSVLITREDSGMRSLEDLKNKSLSLVDPLSTSGSIVPRVAI